MTESSDLPANWWANHPEVDTSAAAARVDQLVDQARRHPAIGLPAGAAHPIRSVGICGAGIMGTGIAAANLRARVAVHLHDASPEALRRAITSLQQAGISASELPAPLDQASPPTIGNLVPCREIAGLADCDLVIETVAENRELKQRIFRQLGSRLRQGAILATNTSTVPLAELASASPDPARFCGLHFCNPVERRPLVEIVRGASTDEQTIAAAVNYVVQIRKLPIVVPDRPGFLVNRLLLPYLNEALEMVCQGASVVQIDAAARQFGMALGPIELFDLIGVDTSMRAGRTLWEAFPDRIRLTPILPALVKRGRLGRKTAVGFYRYPGGDTDAVEDPEFARIIQPYVRQVRTFAPQDMVARLILPMLLEATRTIEEGVVERPQDVDLGVLFGLAFPTNRGGLLYWADSLGAARILEILQQFASLGPRMQPTDLLRSLASSGKRFCE